MLIKNEENKLNQFKLNWKPSPKDERDYKSLRKLAAPVKLPTTFRLAPNIPVYDQGQAGSCVGNGCCSAFRYEVAQLKGNFDFDPSRLFVYWNARDIDGSTNDDAGTYIRSGFKAMNKTGLCLEKLHPYNDSRSSVIKKPNKAAYDDGLKNVTVKYAVVDQTETAIKQTLVAGAVVVFGFTVYDSFFGSWSESNGIMPSPKITEGIQGGHCVVFIGYDDAKKCFLCQNSWSEDWGKGAVKGEGGLFWMPYSFALDPNQADDFWCIEEIKVNDGTTPIPNPSTLDWKTVANVLFKTSNELYAVKKSTLIRLGTALSVEGINEKKSFSFNYNLIKKALNL